MTIIAWDGKSLAVDRMSISGEFCSETFKSRRIDDNTVMAICGQYDIGLALMDWWENGNIPEKWPEAAKRESSSNCLIVVRHGVCYEFETLPIIQKVLAPYMAWGSGRDFAIGAMAMGATAKEAAEVAIKHCISCGFGIDVYET